MYDMGICLQTLRVSVSPATSCLKPQLIRFRNSPVVTERPLKWPRLSNMSQEPVQRVVAKRKHRDVSIQEQGRLNKL